MHHTDHTNRLLTTIEKAKAQHQKLFAVLVDPDKVQQDDLPKLAQTATKAGVDLFFVGGSLLVKDNLDACVLALKANSSIPVILFPGHPIQLSKEVDAILFLSLISGRNAELLIGNHVIAAPFLKQSRVEVMPTGYVLVDGGEPTTVSYISNTTPIPANKPDIAAATAVAGEFLGLRLMYLDAGSGAKNAIQQPTIKAVSRAVHCPIIVGGGIKTPRQASMAAQAGADIVVVGNVLEQNPELAYQMSKAVHEVTSLI